MKIVLVLFLSLTLSFSDNLSVKKVDLYQFAQIVSSVSHVNILIDDKVPKKQIYFYLPKFLKPKQFLSAFRSLVEDCKLRLIRRTGYYYVTYPSNRVITLHQYKFKYLNIDEVQFLKNIYSDINFQFFKVANTLYFKSDLVTAKQIKRICDNLDRPVLRKKVSVTIFSYDLNKAKQQGFKGTKVGFDLANVLMQTDHSITLSMNNLLQFRATFDLLQKNKIIEVLQNPVINLTDGKKTEFRSVKNVPVLQSTTSISDNRLTSQNQYKYRDIGFQISMLPKIFDNGIMLDLNITSETIDTLSETPTTNKINLHNTIKIDIGTAVLLTGYNLHQENTEHFKIPLLGDLPYINPLFKSKSIEKKDQVLSILIQIIN